MKPSLEILHLYRSGGHNYFGHHGKEPDQNPMEECRELHCIAGKGIEGDRFLGYKDDYKGQITFFAHEVYADLCIQLNVHDKSPTVFRRNVITQGLELGTLIGKEFELQGVHFEGTSECSPCYWMDSAFGPGTENALKGRGGLRARILTDGILRRTIGSG